MEAASNWEGGEGSKSGSVDDKGWYFADEAIALALLEDQVSLRGMYGNELIFSFRRAFELCSYGEFTSPLLGGRVKDQLEAVDRGGRSRLIAVGVWLFSPCKSIIHTSVYFISIHDRGVLNLEIPLPLTPFRFHAEQIIRRLGPYFACPIQSSANILIST